MESRIIYENKHAQMAYAEDGTLNTPPKNTPYEITLLAPLVMLSACGWSFTYESM